MTKRQSEIHIRLTAEEKIDLEAAAKALGLQLATWARMVLRKSAEPKSDI